ncbi:MAG: amino acid ABC transporter substrate-binding protein [Helicobacter sp.]|nr:amino acid ABC transporter substrate-binding protein [Helicobacter sp.]
MIKKYFFTNQLKYIFIAITGIFLAACSNEPSAQKDSSLLTRIENKGTITVGTEGTYAPFTYHDESGKLTGYDVEVVRLVAEKLGVKVEFKETNWDSMLAGLKSGRFDMVANQVALNNPERQATFDKSEPYSYSGPMILNRVGDNRISSLSDIKGLKSAQTLSSQYGELARKNDAEVVPVDGMAQALELVKQNRADFTFNDSLALLDYLKKNPNSGLKVAWRSSGETGKILGAGITVNKGNKEALDKISQAIVELKKEGKLKELGIKFFGADISTSK